jgi:hypothetical protein
MKTLIVAGAALLLGATSAVASSPDASSITVPKAGPKTITTAWKGTLSPGMNAPTFTGCKGNALPGADAHKINIAEAPGAYNVVKATMTVAVDSGPSLNGDFIELVDPSGDSAGTDQQHPEMTVQVMNPQPGTWTLLVCEFVPDSLPTHDYSASLTIKTTCKGVSPCPTPPKKRR